MFKNKYKQLNKKMGNSIWKFKYIFLFIATFVLLLVVCQEVIDGYNFFNLIRASSVVNRQSTGAEF
jgi:hypothetical protein